VEFDVVFPRNETYAPTTLMPLVFAFRNSPAWIPLIPLLEWSIRILPTGEFVDYGATDLAWGINTTTDPYFKFVSSQALTVEGNYMLVWTLAYGNCTADPYSDFEILDIDYLHVNDTTNHTSFSIAKGAQAVDLAAASSSCPAQQGMALNVTTALKVGVTEEWKRRDVCGVLAHQQPSPKPCALQLDTAAASSIAAALTASACSAPHPRYTGPCPPKPTQSTSAGTRNRGFATARLTSSAGIAVLIIHALVFIGLVCSF
jgi:hypothetical protein